MTLGFANFVSFFPLNSFSKYPNFLTLANSGRVGWWNRRQRWGEKMRMSSTLYSSLGSEEPSNQTSDPFAFSSGSWDGWGNGGTAFFSPKLSSRNKYLFQPTPIRSCSPPPPRLGNQPQNGKLLRKKNIFRVCSLSRKPQREMGKIGPNKSSAGRKALAPRRELTGGGGAHKVEIG